MAKEWEKKPEEPTKKPDLVKPGEVGKEGGEIGKRGGAPEVEMPEKKKEKDLGEPA